jgi:hypothetical protein
VAGQRLAQRGPRDRVPQPHRPVVAADPRVVAAGGQHRPALDHPPQHCVGVAGYRLPQRDTSQQRDAITLLWWSIARA